MRYGFIIEGGDVHTISELTQEAEAAGWDGVFIADGIDIGGIRDVYLRAPIGTYTGWNLFAEGRFEDGFCIFSGSFVPFAATRTEREAAGDPRPSLEERYTDHATYVGLVSRAAQALKEQRFLLEEDAQATVAAAQAASVP